MSARNKEISGKDYVDHFEETQSPERLKRLLKFIELKEDFRIADFGCGSGMLMEYVAPKVKSYIGVDFSEPFIEAAVRRRNNLNISNAQFVCDDINEFCEQNLNLFDVAFAMDFSEHVYDQEWVDILRSIHRALKLKGKLYLHTPNAQFFLEIMKSHNFIVRQFEEHIAVRNSEENIRLLQKAGFLKIDVKLISTYTILKHLHILSFLPLIGKYFKGRIFMVAEK